MINNFEKALEILDFTDSDKYYIGQIIRRRKDWGNGGLEKGDFTIYNFDFSTEESYKKQIPFLKNLAKSTLSRIYLYPNRCSREYSFKEMQLKMAKRGLNNHFTGMFGDYASVSLSHPKEPRETKKWLFDVDTDSEEILDKLIEFLVKSNVKIYLYMPTANGYHVITSPFPINSFPKIDFVECKKDSQFLLYYAYAEPTRMDYDQIFTNCINKHYTNKVS